MTTFLYQTWRKFGRLVIALALLFCTGLTAFAEAAPQINRAVWKMLYTATDAQMNSVVWLAADDDGDGVSNQAELEAGTDPFKPGSALKICNVSSNETTVSMTFSTVAKKLYVVQATSTLAPVTWTTVTPAIQVVGDGTDKTVAIPKSAGAFFRVLVQDQDSDNDGVSDWAEHVVGLDPMNAASNGLVDANGLPISDNVQATEQIASQGTITISAIDSTAIQPANDLQPAPEIGILKICRNGFAQFLPEMEVNLSIGGTATTDVDYVALPTVVSFGANEVSKEIVVTPLYNPARQNQATVVATVLESPNYSVGGQGWAAVTINPTSAPSGTGLLGRYYDTSSTTAADAANFGQAGTYNFTRNTSPTTQGSIVVSYTTGNLSALQVGHVVKLTFTSGNLNNALYNHQNYTVTAVGASSFTVAISGAAALPASGTGACNLSIQSFIHPPVVQRVDPVINFDWLYGTPNNVTILPNNLADNLSAVWEAYLQPTTAGSYTFQLDADTKARVLLDRNDGNGLQQILEHGWDVPATVGTFKQSAAIPFVVPSSPAQRYRIRVEYVETTGDARCRLQWKVDAGAFANIPQANVFTHTQAATYAFTQSSGIATITLTGHGLVNGNPVTIAFSANNLFLPTSYSGTYTVMNAAANTFQVQIGTTGLPANVAAGQGCFLEGRTASTTTGLFNRCYANTTFSGSPGRVAVDTAITSANNGIWGAGSPDGGLISPETFSARWTGQVQPQYSEEYTFVVLADDAAALKINGQAQPLKFVPASSVGGSTYTLTSATGDAVINYSNTLVAAGSFALGETVRVEPTSGNLNHGVSPTYSYDATTGDTVVNYAAMTNIVPGGFVVGATVQLDPT
ncbi:MAG TPA: PA14 domain-containing protein, partial [Roseimicrobium sp.]|nr:PA14 domain-containing protein [Roseimicrobium sp.]